MKKTTTKTKTPAKIAVTKAPREARIPVTDANIAKAAMRLLSQRLVSTEILYVQRTLGNSASQNELDSQILAVRKLPWASIVAPE